MATSPGGPMPSNEYVFCESYAPVFLALDLRDRGKDIVIITNNSAIVDACADLQVPCMLISSVPGPNNRAGSEAMKELRLRRLAEWIHLNAPAGGVLHFTHTQFSVTGFALAAAWSRENPVRLWPIEQEYPRLVGGWNRPDVWRINTRRGRLRVIAGLMNLETREAGGSPMLGIGDAFLRDCNITVEAEPDRLADIRSRVAQRHTVAQPPAQNLLCTQPIPSTYPVDMAQLSQLYGRIAAHDAVVKLHPRDAHSHGLPEGVIPYPAHLPAELVLGNITNAVVALHSSVLITAAAIPRLKAVSLVELVHWNDIGVKSVARDYLARESRGRVSFPETLQELDSLLQGPCDPDGAVPPTP